MSKPISIDQKEIEALFSVFRPTYFSLSIMFSLCILVLWGFKDFRWWLWVPNIIFGLLFLCLALKEALFKTIVLNNLLHLWHIAVKDEIEPTKFSNFGLLILFVVFIVTFPFLLFYIIIELFFVILQDPYLILGVLLTIFLILISFGSLSEYLSMKFMITEVSKQISKLSVLRMEIDRIEDAEALEKRKRELHEWYLPKADSFLVFFNYYYLMFTKYTSEVGEEGEEEESS